MKYFYFCLIFTVLMLMNGCQDSDKGPDITSEIVMATYDGGKVTIADLDKFKYNYTRKFIPEPERGENANKAVIKDLVIHRIWSNRVDKAFKESEEFKNQYDDNFEKILLRQFFKVKIEDKVKVTEDQIKSRYEDMKEQFKIPEQFKMRHIFFDATLLDDESQKEQLRSKAEAALAELKSGVAFEDVEMKYSDAESNVGEVLGPFNIGKINPVLEEAVISLKPGEFSEIIETRHGYEILMLVDHNQEEYKPLENVRNIIQSELQKIEVGRLLKSYLKEIQGNYDLKVYVENLEISDMSPEEVIASVNDETITHKDMINRLSSMRMINQFKNFDEDRKKKWIEEMMLNAIMVEKEALKEGIDKTPEFKELFNIWEMGELSFQYYNDQTEKLSSTEKPSEEELRQYYEDHKEEARQQEKHQVKEVLIPYNIPPDATNPADKRLAQRDAEKKALEIINKLTEGEDFDSAVQKINASEPNQNLKATLATIYKGAREANYDRNVFTLEEGEICREPIMTLQGYYVVRNMKIFPPEYISFDNLRDKIENSIEKEKKYKIQKELRENLFKEINLTFK